MPLNEIRATHECAVFARPAVVVPQVEIDKVDRLGERGAGEDVFFAQSIHQVLGLSYLLIRRLHHFFRLVVHAFNQRCCMTLGTYLPHPGLCLGVVRAFLGDSICKVVRQPLGRVVRYSQSVDSAHVAGSASGDKHIAGREFPR